MDVTVVVVVHQITTTDPVNNASISNSLSTIVNKLLFCCGQPRAQKNRLDLRESMDVVEL